ncbi:MAG: multicopper oxidase domain-containing protein, partial [Planctomyces sp.]
LHILDGNSEVQLLMRFRTFKGPFVFHCHNVEHEDMRMMFTFDPRLTKTVSPQPIQARDRGFFGVDTATHLLGLLPRK